jgi:hypothetical protein
MLRRIAPLSAACAVLVSLTLAGVAQAAPATFAGQVANGGCDAARTVSVSGPSRIDVEVASTSAADTGYGQILAPDGTVLASGSTAGYDTPSAGPYSVRACTWYSHLDPPSLQYTAIYATGPAGQPALPQTQGQVLGTTTTLSPAAPGTGGAGTFTMR